MALHRKLLAEGLGTALLLAIVVGSGVMAQRLAGGNAAIALLANTLATVAGLYVLIELFAAASGAHFNPAVSFVAWLRGTLSASEALSYAGAQLTGAVLGVWLAHAMFGLDIVQWSAKVRPGFGACLAEGVATFGLLLVILRAPASRGAPMVAAWIGAGYWFTASTSFANPAAVLGRMLTDTFTGIAPSSAPGFVLAEFIGAAAALAVQRLFEPARRPSSPPDAVPTHV
ncbi:aquaporin [Scleromatobacter humisilvae]|uniref:Aquaporin family protein n=1 Tax=Scleromatobacter humisilvae TaxID=2897159 RepID=A0A9X1YJD2_9BURK|nr:MIP/aquaporin family protein [Scleromatobacter humisilvae]MCK9687218.1 aquaporin family protein [Scleromatobacter humisilvae]